MILAQNGPPRPFHVSELFEGLGPGKNKGGISTVKIKWPDVLVVTGLVVFGGVIVQVFETWMPKYLELPLLYHITSPKISHFHRPRALPLDGPVNNADGRGVVDVDGRGGLRVAELLQR